MQCYEEIGNYNFDDLLLDRKNGIIFDLDRNWRWQIYIQVLVS